jgi:hypothetical protein
MGTVGYYECACVRECTEVCSETNREKLRNRGSGRYGKKGKIKQEEETKKLQRTELIGKQQ